MGRPRAAEPIVVWKLSMPQSLAVQVEELIMDPVKGKPIYGERSALIVRLLEEWVEKKPLPAYSTMRTHQ